MLTEKQRGFLQRYYEEDFSFGEIAKEASVSRQAVFDSVKHGEAALENYERVLGLVASGGEEAGALSPAQLHDAAARAAEAADRLRRWLGAAPPDGADTAALDELESLADELEALSGDLRRAGGQPGAEAGAPASETRGSLVLGDGPEVD